jgi:hypothetical protein
VAKSDPTFGKVIRGHFDGDFIAGHDANAEFTHLASEPSYNFVLVF